MNRNGDNHMNVERDTEHEENSLHDQLQFERDKEQELIKNLINKEAELSALEKEKKDKEKQIRHIERSKTWKYSKSLRKLNDVSTKSKGRKKESDQEQYIKELETYLHETEKELYVTKELLNEHMLDDRKLDSTSIVKLIKEAKDKGKLIDYIDQVIRNKRLHDSNYNDLLRYAARVFMNERTDYKNLVYSKILAGLKIEEIPEFLIRAGLAEESIPLKQAASFRASLNMRIRQKQLVEPLPEWLLDNKKDAYTFVDKQNIRTPWYSHEKYGMSDIPQKEGIVIKPVDGAGSRGVYLVYSFNDIIDVKRSQQIHSWEALKKSMENDTRLGWVNGDEWFTEELILEDKEEKIPASDIKFYCFYGKVGLILEITRFPERKHCWWTVTGERVRTGKYDEELFKGNGVSQSEIDMASTISLTIPAPFIRIDFLRSDNGLVFGEFTPKPGNYDEFDQLTDRWLGDHFIEAQGRLMNDLINGKQFTQYKELTAILNK